MEYPMGSAHAGIHMVNGPYWTLKALEFENKSKLVRDRGEHIPSNKDIMLGYYMPLYWKRLGLPRPPDDPQPAYLMFESSDPHLTAHPVTADTFWDPQSDKKGKWGVPEYFFNVRFTRWDPDKQVRYITMGGEGMAMKRGAMWIAYFFKATHGEISPSSQTYAGIDPDTKTALLGYNKEIPLLGNDVEEGFRGMILVTTNANRLLALKSQLAADEEGNLGGVDPFQYDPAKGLRYFPHRIWPNMMLAGDLPERQWAFDINDPRSLLYDQAALLLGLTEYYHQTYRNPDVFTANPPVDGGLVERDLGILARGLSNMVLKNIAAMHMNNGVMVSEWQPSKTKWWVWKGNDRPGKGDTVSLIDSAYAVRALREYVDRMRDPLGNLNNPEDPDLEPELTEQALTILTAHADFLLKVQGKDGDFCEAYNVKTASCMGKNTISEPQFWAIGALTSAYHATSDEKYAEAARKTWNHVNQQYWHEPSGLYRTTLRDDTVFITPESVTAQMWAYREIMFATPVHLIEPLIDRWTRWWVQTVDMTGLQQSEENRTGELCHGVCSKDFDNDGIPWMGQGHGRFGVSPVFANQMAVNIGGSDNQAFAQLDGEIHDPEMYGGKVLYRYQPKTQDQALKGIILPITLTVEYDEDDFPLAPWVNRDPLLRFDGLTYPMPPAIPFKRGSDLTGKQMVEMNCASCHGYSGEGITGIPWKDDSLHRTRDDMFEVPKNGRFTRLMPEWGLGVGDEMGAVLTDDEIYRIVDYVQSQGFKQGVYEDFSGIAHPNTPPKDVYWFISLSYIHGKKSPATDEDIKLVMDAQVRAIREKKNIDIMALLREAEKDRPQSEYASSDPQDMVEWIGGLFKSKAKRYEVQAQKAYPGFFDLLDYQPVVTADYDTFKNVRPLDDESSSNGEEDSSDAEETTDPQEPASPDEEPAKVSMAD